MSAVRRGLLVPSLATLIAFAILIALGTWQLQRKAWKEELIDTLTRKLTAAPVALPSAGAMGLAAAGSRRIHPREIPRRISARQGGGDLGDRLRACAMT